MKKIVIYFFIVLLLLFIKYRHINSLSLELVGDKDIIVEYGKTYEDEGIVTKFYGNVIDGEITVESNVDYKHIGAYKIKYSVSYKDLEKEIERNIIVVDTEKPKIELLHNNQIIINKSNNYIEYGAVASDNYDGNINDKIEIDSSNINTSEAGEYKVYYKVKDSSGNESSIERVIYVNEEPNYKQKVPVLNYHFFYETWDENCHESICLNIKKFKDQLKYLKDNNFYTLTMEEFVRWIYGEIEIPEKSVLITIDDGAHGTSRINGNHLIPALEEYQTHATLFLITGWWDIENYRSDYLDIESHTNDLHYNGKCGYRSKVNCVSYDNLINDLKQSLEVVKSTNSFCYPFYEYTDKTIKALKELNFKVAFTGNNKKVNRNDDKYKLPRYIIYDSTSLDQFKSMVN